MPRAERSAHDQRLVFDAIETLAALTLVGYGVAEAMGRAVSFRRRSLGWTALVVLPTCMLMEAAAAALWQLTPRIWLGPAALLFAGWGAAIYRAELRLVLTLIQPQRQNSANRLTPRLGQYSCEQELPDVD